MGADILMDFFRDQIWQFFDFLIGGLIATIIAIYFYSKSRKLKSLSYQVVTNIPIFSTSKEFKDRLEIRLDDTPVQDVRLIELKLINSGNTSIQPEDFKRPISLSFGESAQIITAEINDTEPKNLVSKDELEKFVSINQNLATIRPVLLNSKDSITIKLLVSQFKGSISVDGRVADIKAIKENRSGQAFMAIYVRHVIQLLIFAPVFFIITLYSVVPEKIRQSLSSFDLLGIFLIFLAVILALPILNFLKVTFARWEKEGF